MNQNIRNLLDFIGSKEAPKGYDQIYTRAEKIVGKPAVSKMTLNQVLALQERMKKSGSSAAGRYQFLQATLQATMNRLKLRGHEVWTPELQDRMAVNLLELRGLNKYLAGNIGATEFANNLAMEWASLPVVSTIRGRHRMVRAGESYYSGDGLNAALHPTNAIMDLVKALRNPSPEVAEPASPDVPAPEAPQKPRGLLSAIISLIKAILRLK
jgi:muramidase (phage lysozyme)